MEEVNGLERFSVKGVTYKKPVAKIVVMSNFFLNGIRSLQTHGIGSIKIAKSEMTLNTPVA